MRDECRVVGSVMIRRKEGDGRHGRHCGQTQQAIEDCGSGATILRLDHHAARRNVGEEGRIKSFMSAHDDDEDALRRGEGRDAPSRLLQERFAAEHGAELLGDRKSTRLNSSHVAISYAVFCLKKKKTINT